MRRLLAVLAFAWLVGVAIAGIDDHHGVDSGRAALAIAEVRPADGFGGGYVLEVECATDLEVTVGTDHGGSGLPEVTVWGRPKVGRCRREVALPVGREALSDRPGHPALTKFVDGATSEVVDLPTA